MDKPTSRVTPITLVAIAAALQFAGSMWLFWSLANNQQPGDWWLCVPMFALCAAWLVLAGVIKLTEADCAGCDLWLDQCGRVGRLLDSDNRVGR